jgi:hypothetical protein
MGSISYEDMWLGASRMPFADRSESSLFGADDARTVFWRTIPLNCEPALAAVDAPPGL